MQSNAIQRQACEADKNIGPNKIFEMWNGFQFWEQTSTTGLHSGKKVHFFLYIWFTFVYSYGKIELNAF